MRKYLVDFLIDGQPILAPDENVTISSLTEGVRFFKRLLKDYKL